MKIANGEIVIDNDVDLSDAKIDTLRKKAFQLEMSWKLEQAARDINIIVRELKRWGIKAPEAYKLATSAAREMVKKSKADMKEAEKLNKQIKELEANG